MLEFFSNMTADCLELLPKKKIKNDLPPFTFTLLPGEDHRKRLGNQVDILLAKTQLEFFSNMIVRYTYACAGRNLTMSGFIYVPFCVLAVDEHRQRPGITLISYYLSIRLISLTT